MMKRSTIILSLALASTRLAAVASEPWSMDSCMAYAVSHSTAVEMQRVEARQSKTDYRAAVAAFLPSVEGGVSGQYTWGRGIDPETNTYTNVTTFNNYYQLYATLTVFDGGRTLNAFRSARLSRRTAAAAIDKARDAKAIEVMQCYVEAVYAEASIRLAEQKLAESRALLARTQRMFELGSKSRPDVAQVEAQVASDDYNLTHQQNEARRTMLALKSAMNFPVADTLLIGGDTKSLEPLASPENADLLSKQFVEVSPEVVTAKANVGVARYAYLQSKASLLPSLTLQGGVATNYYRNLSQGGVAESFSRQFRNNSGEYLVLSLSVPIFNSSSWRSVRRAKSNWLEAQLTLDETRRQADSNVRQAVMDRDGYAKEITMMERKVESDSMAHRLNTRKYEEGMLSVFDLQTSSQTLLQSRITLLQMRMLYAMKSRLVDYYRGRPLVVLNEEKF